MNCPNCAAPMTLFAQRSYFHCRHCGTFFFPNESSRGLRILDDPEVNRLCPICGRELAHANWFGQQGLHCRSCRGFLFEQWTFGELIQKLRAFPEVPPVSPPPLDPEELERRIRCPVCGETMNTHPYYGPGNIVIDTCPGCQVIWLDPGEIRAAADAPGRDRGKADIEPNPRKPDS